MQSFNSLEPDLEPVRVFLVEGRMKFLAALPARRARSLPGVNR